MFEEGSKGCCLGEISQEIWECRNVAWEAQAGAAFAEKGEGMLGGCCYQQEKLLSGKAYPDVQNTNTKYLQSLDSNYV